MKIAIVTGASSGLGEEFAKQIPRLYKNLDELWVIARRTDRLTKLKKELSLPVRIFDSDLKRDYIYIRLERELKRLAPDIRMLVNAAGFGKVGECMSLNTEEQLDMVDVNIRALTKLTCLSLPYMSRGSRILQIASAAAFAPQPGFAVYAASKSYVYSFSRGLAAELKEKGIFVTAVCPGPVDTEFFDHAGGAAGSMKKSLRVRPEAVVRQALLDAVSGREVSVYGGKMKAARLLAKLLPDGLLTQIMRKINEQGDY